MKGAYAKAFRNCPELAALIATSTALLAVRAFAASRVGYGDSEALYACYALHPRLAYLDHPGLIGLAARALGGGAAPSPAAAHAWTAVLATLIPWLVSLVCRACGATWRRALGAGLLVAVVPEMAIGLFALTPDLPLAFCWMSALGAAAVALRAAPGSPRAGCGFAVAGVGAGVAAAAKVSGVLLLVSLACAYGSSSARSHRRTVAPWLGIAAGLVVVAPIAAFEYRAGWPLLRHRLVDTQSGAGLSLRNAAALLGGQAAYLSPLIAAVALFAARAAWRDRRDAVGSLLFFASAVPAAMLVPLCLWSRVAEPHWLAPAALALVPVGARAVALPGGRRLLWAAGLIAASEVVAVHAWVLVPALARLSPAYDARLDIANELYGWPDVVAAVSEEAARATSSTPGPADLVVVGPHWVICAQLEAALQGRLPVGCNSPIPDDFDAWYPRERWRAARIVIWVTDARFGPAPSLASYVLRRAREVPIARAGRTVRVFEIGTFAKRLQDPADRERRVMR